MPPAAAVQIQQECVRGPCPTLFILWFDARARRPRGKPSPSSCSHPLAQTSLLFLKADEIPSEQRASLVIQT